MATARKNYARSKAKHQQLPAAEPFEWACFLDDVLDGTIEAEAVHEVRAGNGKLIRLEYDDPDGKPGSRRDGRGPGDTTTRPVGAA